MAKVLNPSLELVSYNGGCQRDNPQYDVSNCLTFNNNSPHCSKKGANFDLVLKVKDGVDLLFTNFVARTPFQTRCSAPLKVGAVWFSNAEPTVSTYSSSYDNCEPNNAPTVEPRPDVFFSIDQRSGEFQVSFDEPKSARYVHVKLISAETTDDPSNIDVGYIGFVGFEKSEARTTYKPTPIDEQLGVTRVRPKPFNELNAESAEYLSDQPAVVLLSGNSGPEMFESLKSKVKVVAESGTFNNEATFFFASEGDPDQELAGRLRSFGGFGGNEPELVIFYWTPQQKYRFSKIETLTEQSLQQFVQDWRDGKLAPHIKSGVRPPNDRFAEHPELFQLTTNSFKELVLDNDKDFLVDVYADWCGPCVAVGPTIAQLAKLLSGVPSVAVGKISTEENEVDKKLFPERGIPNIKLFVGGKKDQPIKYSGDRSLVDFLEFIHKNVSKPFELEPMKRKAERIQALAEVEEEVKEFLSEFENNRTLAEGRMSVEEKEELSKHEANIQVSFKALGEEDETGKGVREKIESLKSSSVHKKLVEQAKKAKDEKEKAGLKNVKKIHDAAEYKSVMEEAKAAGKLGVVDFTAVWCGPCRYIAPHFANFSEQFPEVVFMKVDVDEVSEVAASEGVNCMPTFMFFKGGSKVDTLEGADLESLKNLIEKHK